MTSYTDMAVESLLCENPMWRSLTVNRLVAESEFILSSLENGKIGDPVQEAISKETAKQTINTLRAFLDNVMSKFKGKVADYYERYIPWVTKNEDQIKAAAEKGSIELAPYWKGKVDADKQKLTSLPGEAFKKPYDVNDVSFASAILPSIKTVADLEDTTKLSNILKNKYRFGVEEEDNAKIKREELKEQTLVQQIDGMIKYVQEYKKISDALSKISENWKNLAKRFQDDSAVGESTNILTKDTFLMVESALLLSTDLSLLEGFELLPNSIMEAEGGESSNKDAEPITKVEDTSTTGDGNGDKKPPSGDQGRYRLADKFTRLAFSAFMTACEERFIVYIKVISKILGESPQGEKKEKK